MIPTKLCPDCGKHNPITMCAKNKTCTFGVQSVCAACASKRTVKYRNKNKEQWRAYEKDWVARNQDKVRAKGKRYYEKNKHKSREKKRRFMEKHPDYNKIQKLRRVTRKRNLPNNFTSEDWEKCKEAFGWECAYCNDTGKLQPDHFIPLSSLSPDNPGTVSANIVPACPKCNRHKQNKEAGVWLIEQFGKPRARRILKRIKRYFDTL